MTRLTLSNLPPEISDYIALVEMDEPKQCKDQHALIAYVRRVIANEELYIDEEKLCNYLKLEKYWEWKLFPWEKFLIALWLCTYTADKKTIRWKTCFSMLGRGAGKDGFIAFISMCLLSPFNPIKQYDIDICANAEDQATRPVEDLVAVLEANKKLDNHYYHTKQVVKGLKNLGKMKGRTSGLNTKDGMRTALMVLNEVHQYQDYKLIEVFKSGQGKHAESRVGIFSSNGHISDGPLDDYIHRSERILYENEDDRRFLPFVCRLDSKAEVDDKSCWFKANPSLQYMPDLLQEIDDAYYDWKESPETNTEFLAKRMGLRAGFTELGVTSYEKVLATRKELPDLKGWDCTVGIDYAELSDWASVVFHFKKGANRYDICHTWICTQSKTLGRVKAPWEAWCDKKYCTRVSDPTIAPELLTAWIAKMQQYYHIKKLGMDSFRWALMSDALMKIGFDAKDKNKVKLIRPSDIMKIEPVVQNCFDNNLFSWGDYPPLRWAVNNTKRVLSSKSTGSTGNYYYAKVEPKSRKTDPWMALVAAMICEDVLGSVAVDIDKLPPAFTWR